MAEWLGTALQKLLLRFESARDLPMNAPDPRGVHPFRYDRRMDRTIFVEGGRCIPIDPFLRCVLC